MAREEIQSVRWERLALWWLVASGGAVGIFVGAALALGLLKFWRPSAILDFCEFLSFVICAVGIAMSFLCDKKAKWARDHEKKERM
jgi:hypothetical protein